MNPRGVIFLPDQIDRFLKLIGIKVDSEVRFGFSTTSEKDDNDLIKEIHIKLDIWLNEKNQLITFYIIPGNETMDYNFHFYDRGEEGDSFDKLKISQSDFSFLKKDLQITGYRRDVIDDFQSHMPMNVKMDIIDELLTDFTDAL